MKHHPKPSTLHEMFGRGEASLSQAAPSMWLWTCGTQCTAGHARAARPTTRLPVFRKRHIADKPETLD